MEVKKSKKADLEGKKMLFLEIGLIISLSIMIFAFEWSSDGNAAAVFANDAQVATEEEMIITEELDTPPPPPAPVDIPVLSDELVIVDNSMDIASSNLFTSEDSRDFAVTEVAYTPPTITAPVEEEVEDIVFEVVQEKPSFMGGDANEFTKWVNKNIAYPAIAQENGISGKVILQFRVGPDGKVSNVRVVRGVDPALDKEAVRVVSMSPTWTPGKQNDRKIGVIYTFPVNFQLQY